MPSFIQRTPDMFAINSKFVFVEVKGCKANLKIKFDDYSEYIKWNDIAPLMFFVYSTTYDKNYLFYIEAFQTRLLKAQMGSYNDNDKIYMSIPISCFDDYIVSVN